MAKRWMRNLAARLIVALACAAAVASAQSTANEDPAIRFFVLVKSSNYSQDDAGHLALLNYHFFSEIFPQEQLQQAVSGELLRHDAPVEPMVYEHRESNLYVEGGHFQTLADLDAAYPNGDFIFRISVAADNIEARMSLSGENGQTDLPAPIRISLSQDARPVAPKAIDPSKALTIRWSDYSNGRADPRGIVDDMIFVVVQDCQGERIVHSGLPFQRQDYLRYSAHELRVPSDTLEHGEPYAMFVEFPHVVDSVIAKGVPGFTSYATATYLDLQTTGDAGEGACLPAMPPMDTGQTDRSD